MIGELNKKLRKVVLIVGCAIVAYKVIEDAREEQIEAEDGFQKPEFDDIW